MAVDMATSGADQTVDASTTESLNTPQDDRTTVYRSPEDDSDEHDEHDEHDEPDEPDDHDQSPSTIKPAPPSTTYQGGSGQQGPANTSKSS